MENLQAVDLVLIRVSKALGYKEVEEYSSLSPCILTGLLDSYVESHGYTCTILDLEVDDYTHESLRIKLNSLKPRLIGIMATGVNVSASTQSMPAVIDISLRVIIPLRETLRFTCFIFGGHPTVLPERTLRETLADIVVVGEGYSTVVELLRFERGAFSRELAGLAFLSQGILVKTSSVPLVDVNTLPKINWSKMHPAKYRAHNWHCFGRDVENDRSPYAVIWTSIGCAYPCEFCCINNLYEKRLFRFRDMASVVEEIDELVTRYKVTNLRIYDELFIMRHPRIAEFCDLLELRDYRLNIWCYARPDSVEPGILQRLKKVGVNWIGYGFEAGDNDSALKDINKKIRKTFEYSNSDIVKMTRDAGINMIGLAILGLYDDDVNSMKKNIEFLKRHKFEWNNIYPAFAYPGTPFYKRYIESGLIQEPTSWEEYALYGYHCKPLPTRNLTPAEVLEFRDQAIIDYYKDEEVRADLLSKFGVKTLNHIDQMFARKLPRKLLA